MNSSAVLEPVPVSLEKQFAHFLIAHPERKIIPFF